jgi:hypothetical protein
MIWAIAIVVAFASEARAQTLVSATRGRTNVAVVTTTAPIFLLPDDRRVPLVIAAQGSTVSMISEDGDWVNVEFSHDGFERRQGFIQKQFVRPREDTATAQQPSPPSQADSPSPGAAGLAADFAPLTNQQQAEAVRQGLAMKGAIAGVGLSEASSSAASAPSGSTSPPSTLSVRLYTPRTWIEQQASDAAKQGRPFTARDITADMLEPVLRVVAHATEAAPLSGRGAPGGSAAEHVVLRDDSRRLVVQPLSKAPWPDSPASAASVRAAQGLVATFPLADVRELSGPNNDRELLIVVVGYGGRSERIFTIGPNELAALRN